MKNNAKIDDLTKRMMKLTTRSGMSVGEVATAYYNLLGGLALEACNGDKEKAAKMLREAAEEIALRLENPALLVRMAVHNGKVVEI